MLGELPSSKLMKMKWNPVTQKDPIQELTGYDDPKFPKAKYHAVVKSMEALAKAFAKEKVDRGTIWSVFENIGKRLSIKYGK